MAIWSVLCAVCLTVLALVAQAALTGSQNVSVLPTLAVLPSITPVLPTHTPTITGTPTAAPTATPSATWTASPTLIPSATPTLSERVLVVTAIMPGVVVMPAATELPMDVTVLYAPPPPVEPLIAATLAQPPFTGWNRFESDYPTVRYIPAWTPRLAQIASEGQYHRTEDINSRASFAFIGEAVQVRYAAAPNMGIFELVIDGQVLETVDAYTPALTFPVTGVHSLPSGPHMLEIRPTGRKNRASEGTVVGLDAVYVFQADAHTLILPPSVLTVTPTHTPRSAEFELVAAPPTTQPTASPIPPRQVSVAVVIAYDENRNRAADPAEGVRGVTVRVVETTTNRPLASSVTDGSGFAALELETDAPLQVAVPYFDKVWAVGRGRSGATETFTLLIPAANQPGLIP